MLFHETPQFLRVTTPPAVEPVALASLRMQLSIDSTSQDTWLQELLEAARETVETDSRRALVIQDCQLVLDAFACEIEIRRPPVFAISSIAYIDADGDLQTLAADQYIADLISEPGRIYQAYGTSWPVARCESNAVRVNFKAGYAAGFTADAAANTITSTGRMFTDGEFFQLSNSGGALPAGLAAGTTYYVRDSSGATCKLAATLAGAAIDITGAGTGTHFVGTIPRRATQAVRMLAAHWYRNREAVGTVGTEIALAYDALIQRLKWSGTC